MKRAIAALAVLSAAALSAGPAQAALYRCGNVFQDRPCDGTMPVAPSGRNDAPAAGQPATPATTASRFAVVCKREGEFAQQIQWKREGGATMERQLAELPAGAQGYDPAAVVQSVYGRRGSAPEIRAAVESECVQRREQAAAAAEQLRLLQEAAGAPVSRPAAAATAAPASEAAPPAAAAARPPAGPNPMCGSLKERRSGIEARLRTGSSNAKTMEDLQQQRRDVEGQLSANGC